MTQVLIPPYGGRLVNFLVHEEARGEVKAYASTLPSLQLSDRAMCDFELLATGGFSPLDRFMGQADHQRVLDEMRLVSGHLFPLPITLPVELDQAPVLNTDVALRTPKNDLLAILTVEEIYPWDRDEVADKAFLTRDLRHPLVVEMGRWGSLNVSGRLQVLRLPARYDFRELRLTPAEVRHRLQHAGHRNVVAFQTRNPLHRVPDELTNRATQT